MYKNFRAEEVQGRVKTSRSTFQLYHLFTDTSNFGSEPQFFFLTSVLEKFTPIVQQKYINPKKIFAKRILASYLLLKENLNESTKRREINFLAF
jgi:hypothetical protein